MNQTHFEPVLNLLKGCCPILPFGIGGHQRIKKTNTRIINSFVIRKRLL